MSLQLSVVGLFCEDLRKEEGGSDTLIGVLSDIIRVPTVPGIMPKLGVYVRINFDVTHPPKAGSLVMKFPDNGILVIGEISEDIIKKAADATIKEGGQLVGIKLLTTFSPFPVPTAGRVQLFLKLGDEECLCGELNFVLAPDDTSAASEPLRPSAQ